MTAAVWLSTPSLLPYLQTRFSAVIYVYVAGFLVKARALDFLSIIRGQTAQIKYSVSYSCALSFAKKFIALCCIIVESHP